MKPPILLRFLFVLAIASLSLACDSGEAAQSPLEPGTFEVNITGDVGTELAGVAVVSIDAFGGEAELFLKLQTPQADAILLSKSSLEPLEEGIYSVGTGLSDPESFAGFVTLGSEGPLSFFVVRSGTVTVNHVSATSAEGTIVLEAGTIDDTQLITVQGMFNALAP